MHKKLATLSFTLTILFWAPLTAFAAASSKPGVTPTVSPSTSFADIQNCELNPTTPKSPPFSLGFTRDPMWAPTHGTLNIAVTYLNYLDGTLNPKAMYEIQKIQEPNVQKFYEASSFGKLHVNFMDNSKVYTISKSLLSYNLKGNAPDWMAVYTDAMKAAQADYDFSKVDELLIMLPDNLPVTDIGPGYGFKLTVGGNTITRGFDVTYINPSNHQVIDDGWLTHELGHTLGFTHPFLYGGKPAPYAWDVMQYDNTAAPDLFEYEKLIVGWIDGTQVDCLTSSPKTPITAFLAGGLNNSGQSKMVMYRVSDTQALVIESRRKSTIDPLTPSQEGVLVYKLDLNKGFGEGVVTLIYKNPQVVNTQHGTEMYGSLHQGESVASNGIRVTVLKSSSSGDFVQLSSAK